MTIINRVLSTGNNNKQLNITAYQSFRRFYQRSVHAVHFVVQSARVAQVVPRPVSPPQRGGYRAAVDALAPLAELELHGGI